MFMGIVDLLTAYVQFQPIGAEPLTLTIMQAVMFKGQSGTKAEAQLKKLPNIRWRGECANLHESSPYKSDTTHIAFLVQFCQGLVCIKACVVYTQLCIKFGQSLKERYKDQVGLFVQAKQTAAHDQKCPL